MVARDSSNLAVTVLGLAVLVVLAGVIWFGVGADQLTPAVVETASSEQGDRQPIRVHVSGAVESPGVVEVPDDSIVADAIAAAGGAASSADLSAINLAATLRSGERVVVPDTSHSGGRGQPESREGIDLNAASAGALEVLPGVGPVLAGRIVAFRDEHGPFLSIEDLLDVPGIGEAKLSQMREAISHP